MATADRFTGWHKSSRSKDSNECVEVGYADRGIGVRDTKHVGPVLEFAAEDWRAFLRQVKDGGHDLA